MKQKLALARVMLHRPQVILLDEPSAGLDVMAAVAVREDLARLVANEGTTVFLTTHNMAEAEKLCAQVAMIREGKLLAVDSPDALRRRIGMPQVEIYGRGFSDDALDHLRLQPRVEDAVLENGHLHIRLRQHMDIAPLVNVLVSDGVEVEEIRRNTASLEEAFVALMEEPS